MVDTLHIPVMLREVMASLAIKKGEVYIDCTLGAGGYSRAILAHKPQKLYAFDRDISVQKLVADLLSQDNFSYIHDSFAHISNYFQPESVAGIVFDLGVSSMQLDDRRRGFSFMDHQQKLDMRMDQSQQLSAITILAQYSEQELANILYHYGDEKESRSIARHIVNHRSHTPIETVGQLVEIIKRAKRQIPKKHHIATRSFQALRIAVNDEITQLNQALNAAVELLKPKGRLVIITFHSLEVQVIRKFIKQHKHAGVNRYLPDLPEQMPEKNPKLKKIHFQARKKLLVSDDEINTNIRSRSASMHTITKL
jgi:16S rRNA (cytosine1402-N4)-methyltransferase